jgi:hypothetical protein
VFAVLKVFLFPLSLALSREGRGDFLFESSVSFKSGDSNKQTDYIGF